MLIQPASENPIEYSVESIEDPILLNDLINLCPRQGSLCVSLESTYCYLKIDDRFILESFPRIKEKIKEEIELPTYFSTLSIGAHISIIYPEEIKTEGMKDNLKNENQDSLLAFDISQLIKISVFNKTYYVLSVISPSLEAVRKKHSLPSSLNFKGLLVPFHITLAIKRHL
jgi:hypothetical protein